jgi:gluconokinase
MGVAGCGKSSLGAAVAAGRGPAAGGGRRPPQRRQPREDAPGHRADRCRPRRLAHPLAELLRAHPQGAVLTCSALRRAYRERLRTPSRAALCVSGHWPRRGAGARGRTAFALLLGQPGGQPVRHAGVPVGEPGVLRLDATCPAAPTASRGDGLAANRRLHERDFPPPRPARNRLRAGETAMAAVPGRDGAGGVHQRGAALRLWQRHRGQRRAVAPAVRLDGLHRRHRAYPAGEHMAFTSLVGMLRGRSRWLFAVAFS